MKRRCLGIVLGFVSLLVCTWASDATQRPGKKGKDQAASGQLSPELRAFEKQLEAMPAPQLRQLFETEKKALADWCRRNNFDPPGHDNDRPKGKHGRGKKGRDGKVVISKSRQAELLVQYEPWKAKLDLIQQELRDRDHDGGKDQLRKKRK